MAKTIKISVTCPKCSTKLAIPITEKDLGTKKQSECPKCQKKLLIPISDSLASKFESDPTNIGNDSGDDVSLILEVIPNGVTAYQSFELTSDYYTIGRCNSSGPEFRPDVEIITVDKKMSRKHAAIKRKGKVGFTLVDLGNKNGVTLNGQKLEPDEEMYVKDGDEFGLGDTLIRISFTQVTKKDELTR